MSNPLSIQAALPIRGSGDSTAPSRSAAPAEAPAAKPVPLFVNPSFKFDPTVGLVVIDFHNDSGAVTDSIPSQRQLEAYRTHRETPPGEPAPPAPKSPPPVDGKTSAG
jgi:hypothetical protein